MNRHQWKQAAAEILKKIDEATEPRQMSPEEAEECIGELIDDLKIRQEALREDMQR